MKMGLVSIISPCYNIGIYLPKFFESLLQQTYKNLEVILVDDGSTDDTPKIISKYIPLLEKEGYAVKLVSKENGGLASAIDFGLKFFTGEFLTWPDPDDWLAPNSIEERVKIFRDNPEIGLVRCNAEKVDGGTGKMIGFFDENSDKVYIHDGLFSDLVRIRTYFAPVCYMVRSSAFLEENPQRSIFVSRDAMQNLQMLLPVSFKYKSIQMEKPLAFYLVRAGSLSRSGKTPRDAFKWDSVMWEVTRQTLLRMREIDASFINKIKFYYVRNRLLPAAFRAQMKKESMMLIQDSDLGPLNKALSRGMVLLQCSGLKNLLDFFSLRNWSKVLYRLFFSVVQS